jgi:Fe-S-cluster containining protein
MYDCNICGCCCRKVGLMVINAIITMDEADKSGQEIHPIIEEIASFPYDILESGACSQLDGEICKVYQTRPLICNTDKMYEKFWQHVMTKDEHYKQTKLSCDKLRRK